MTKQKPLKWLAPWEGDNPRAATLAVQQFFEASVGNEYIEAHGQEEPTLHANPKDIYYYADAVSFIEYCNGECDEIWNETREGIIAELDGEYNNMLAYPDQQFKSATEWHDLGFGGQEFEGLGWVVFMPESVLRREGHLPKLENDPKVEGDVKSAPIPTLEI